MQRLRSCGNGFVGLREVFAPVNEALAVGAAENLLTALQFNEGLRRYGDMAAAADAFADRHDDGMLKTLADKFVTHENGLRHKTAGLFTELVQLEQLVIADGQLFLKAFFLDFQFGLQGGVRAIQLGKSVILELQFFQQHHLLSRGNG